MAFSGRSKGPTLFSIAADNLDVNAVSHTASFDTNWVGLSGAQYIAIWLKMDETAGSGTFDIDVEVSDDNGTTVFDMPQDLNSETKAAFTQVTGDINALRMWRLPPSGPDSNMKLRLEFTAASSPTYTITARYSLFYPG